jgi:hypothetical protein
VQEKNDESIRALRGFLRSLGFGLCGSTLQKNPDHPACQADLWGRLVRRTFNQAVSSKSEASSHAAKAG